MATETIEFFQNDGADETLAQAKKDFEQKHPGKKVLDAKFAYAYPGRPGEGRWVGIDISWEKANDKAE
jgi:hypothetical protein